MTTLPHTSCTHLAVFAVWCSANRNINVSTAYMFAMAHGMQHVSQHALVACYPQEQHQHKSWSAWWQTWWLIRQTGPTAQKCMPWLSYERPLTIYNLHDWQYGLNMPWFLFLCTMGHATFDQPAAEHMLHLGHRLWLNHLHCWRSLGWWKSSCCATPEVTGGKVGQ